MCEQRLRGRLRSELLGGWPLAHDPAATPKSSRRTTRRSQGLLPCVGMSILHRLSDPSHPDSLARRFRESRFAFFSELLTAVPRPIRPLDIGGTPGFWETMGFADQGDVDITLCNVASATPSPSSSFRFVEADACNLDMFSKGEFDVVFSNSVIEHVGDLTRCRAMADEVRRVGQRYFIQTPNRHFPIDPTSLSRFFSSTRSVQGLCYCARFRLRGSVASRTQPTPERSHNPSTC